jgi:hypothetical protein
MTAFALISDPARPPLQTQERLSTAKHKAQTLAYSQAPSVPKPIDTLEVPQLTSPFSRNWGKPHKIPQHIEMSLGFKQFSPSPPWTVPSISSKAHQTTNQRLKKASQLP